MDSDRFEDVLERLITDRHLSQSDIARAAGVDRSRVSEWRRGLAYPSPQALERLADNFGLDLPRLQFLCEYRLQAPNQEHTPDEIEAIALYRQIPLEQKSAATLMLRGLAITGASNRHSDGASTRPTADRRALKSRRRTEGETEDQGAVPTVYAHGHRTVVHFVDACKRLLWAPNPWPTAQVAR